MPMTDKVKRYDATGDYAFPVDESPEGEFVSYDDYEHVCAERDKLKVALTVIADNMLDGASPMEARRMALDALIDPDGMISANKVSCDG